LGARARRYKGPLCRKWAMPNGRCYWHGGASTGARTLEGKERQAEGRRRYYARLKAAGLKRPRSGGRKAGKGWITDRLLERARGKSRRLGGWSGLAMDNKLVLTLLKSAEGDEKACLQAKVMMRKLEIKTAKSFLKELGMSRTSSHQCPRNTSPMCRAERYRDRTARRKCGPHCVRWRVRDARTGRSPCASLRAVLSF
jgi:hypothetical protein